MSFQEIHSLGEFEELISQGSLVVVDFHAVWCGPCKVIAPKLQKLAEANPDVVFAKVDVDELSDVSLQQNIRSIPTLQFFTNGDLLDEVIGANYPKIESTLSKLRA